MTKSKSAIPEGFRSLTPYLIVAGASNFLDFIKNAFEAKEKYLMRDPDGVVHHAEVHIGDAIIEFADAGRTWSAMPAGLHYYVKNADEVYAKALKSRGTSLYEPGLWRPRSGRARSGGKLLVHCDAPRRKKLPA